MASMDSAPAHLDDLERMRVVSHPARWRVLQELWSGTALTSTEAAALVGLTPSAMSYHLRRLAKLGLVEQAESADGRERPWRASTDGMRMTGQPDDALGGTMMQNLRADVERTLAVPPPVDGDPRPWPANFGHRRLRLTRAEAKDLHARFQALVDEVEASVASAGRDGTAPGVGAMPDAETDPDAAVAPDAAPDYLYDVFWIAGARP